MQVGFVTQLLWSRYGSFWIKLFKGIGAEIVFADARNITYQTKRVALKEIDGLVFRLAALQALSLNVNFIVAPDVNYSSKATKGSAQDPWIANFVDTLARKVKGLPPILRVPATLNIPPLKLEKLVTQTLYPLTRQVNEVRLVWERYHSSVKYQSQPEPHSIPKGDYLGVIGQPWLVDEAIVSVLKTDKKILAQHQIDPNYLQQEGLRVRNDLISSDSEVIGAAHYLNRKGNVKEIIMLADKTSGADIWLTRRVKHIIHKPFTIKYIQDLLPTNELINKLTKTSFN